MARGDVIALVERAYSLEGTEAEWLAGLAESAAPLLRGNYGTYAWTFESEHPREPSEMIFRGRNGDLRAQAAAAQRLGLAVVVRDRDIAAAYDTTRAFKTMSDCFGGEAGASKQPWRRSEWLQARVGPHVRFSWGFVDIARALAITPGGAGVMLTASLDHYESGSEEHERQWQRPMVHVAAGLRLRRRLTGAIAGDGDAVLTLDGRLCHAERDATAAPNREALRLAAIAVDRARGRLRREDPDGALDLWRGLVEGRWSLVDRFDRDGRHYLIARRNDPELPDPRALTERERAALGYAALGWANKRIAYALGVTPSTASTLLGRARTKLRAERVSLPGHDALRTATIDEELAVGSFVVCEPLEELSPAEREVAQLALHGISNAEIAKRRGAALRTVANQLASIYRKLGVGSRAELATFLARLRG